MKERLLRGMMERIASDDRVTPLGELAEVRIGIVTGANEFFIRDRASLRGEGIPAAAVMKTISRTRWLRGLTFTAEDMRELVGDGERVFMIRPSGRLTDSEPILRWIAGGEADGIAGRMKCRIRAPWHRVPIGPIPDAFATCCRGGPPLIAINEGRVRCTNSLHEIRWRTPVRVNPMLLAIGILTSFSAVWAELHGRRYGGGVLKLEPGTLRRMPIPIVPEAFTAGPEIDALLRAGREREAREVADEAALVRGLGLARRDLAILRETGGELFARRVPPRMPEGRAHGRLHG